MLRPTAYRSWCAPAKESVMLTTNPSPLAPAALPATTDPANPPAGGPYDPPVPAPPAGPQQPAPAPALVVTSPVVVAVLVFLVALLVPLACAAAAYLVYTHPAAREPLNIAVTSLAALGTVAAAVFAALALLRRR